MHAAAALEIQCGSADDGNAEGGVSRGLVVVQQESAAAIHLPHRSKCVYVCVQAPSMHTHDTHSCNRGVQLCLAMLAALHLLHSDYLASVKFAAADNAASPCAAALTKG